MAERLGRTSKLPLSGHPLVDLGLFPQDVQKMKGMRAIKADSRPEGAPVDLLRYATLTSGLTLAMAQGTSLGALMVADPTRETGNESGKKHDDSGSGGFG